jgi:hypothetical protein
MLTATVNIVEEVEVEAYNSKDLYKLVRKEEARQKKLYAIKCAKREIADTKAWAQLGMCVDGYTGNIEFYKPEIKVDERHSWKKFVELNWCHITLRYTFMYDWCSVTDIMATRSGRPYAMRVIERSPNRTTWYFVGEQEGELGMAVVGNMDIVARLDSDMAAYYAKQKDEDAA